MPAKVLPGVEEIEKFGRLLVARGFERVTAAEFNSQLAGVKLVPPACRKKRESGTLSFRYREPGKEKGFVVWVWTTYMPALQKAAEHAAGWVLIVEGNSVRYSSHPVPRTKSFLHTLLWLAVIAKWRVDYRPECPLCGTPMGIAFGSEILSRFWRCRNRRAHGGIVTLDWKTGLPDAALEFERPIDEARAKRFAKDRAEGKEPGRGIKRRKRWSKQPR